MVNVPANPKAMIMEIKELYANGKLEISKEMFDTICGIDIIPSVKELEEDKSVIWIDKGDPSLQKPFPHEHSCRLHEPDKYEKFARKNCDIKSDDKCIDVIYGIADGKSEIQAYRYPKGVWEVDSARSHCKSHEGSFEAASSSESSFEERLEKAICIDELREIHKDFFNKYHESFSRIYDEQISLLKSVTKLGTGDAGAAESGATKLDAGDADGDYIEIED